LIVGRNCDSRRGCNSICGAGDRIDLAAGVGTALLRHLFDRAGDGRVEWAVLDWNEPSIAFYRRQGARPVAGWTRYRWTAGGRGGG